MGIDFNGVNGNTPLFGNNIGSTKGNEKTYDFDFGEIKKRRKIFCTFISIFNSSL